eukprot:350874-Chlamydomonas_euryale.AAC.16
MPNCTRHMPSAPSQWNMHELEHVHPNQAPKQLSVPPGQMRPETRPSLARAHGSGSHHWQKRRVRSRALANRLRGVALRGCRAAARLPPPSPRHAGGGRPNPRESSAGPGRQGPSPGAGFGPSMSPCRG